MNIDDLKQLMDEFDPSTLLPELDTLAGKLELVMRIAVLIGPIILLVMGILYLIASPREANYHFGYRCWFGMGSVNAWRYSQRIAGLIWGLLGLGMTIAMLVISGGFAELEAVDMVWKAIRCVLWEAALVAVSTLAINAIVALNYNSQGERRRKQKV